MSLIKHFLLTVFIIGLSGAVFCQNRDAFTDGPYVRYQNDSIEVLWVTKGELSIHSFLSDQDYRFEHELLPDVDVSKLEIVQDTTSHFVGIEKFVAVSDIHGQFDLFLEFLKAHQIIDDQGNWIFENGHLVIVGDVLDRGPKVIESLWYLYHLEKKAELSGGKVHFLLGNHEMMVINNDLRYLHNKYKYTAGISKRNYADFFDQSSFFGKWLSSKNISISINDILFVHGGISDKVTNLGKSLAEINIIFQTKILFNHPDSIQSDSLLSLLAKSDGPLWYRGYSYPSEYSLSKAKNLLTKWKKKAVVVGHTSLDYIKGFYNNRIILIDSSIKRGKSGEILLWEDGKFYRCLLDGSKVKLVSEEDKEEKVGIFTRIYNDESPKLKLITPMKTIYKNDEEIYEEGLLYYAPEGRTLSFNVGVRTSGNMRRKVCSYPPLKVNFKKKEIKSFGFTSSDKLKLVMSCKNGEKYNNYLKKENLIYELYRFLDPSALRSKLIELTIDDMRKDPKTSLGLLVEHKDNYAERTGNQIIETGVITKQSIDQENYLTFCLFQFIIANPDFHLRTRHNLRAVKMKDKKELILIPYDFDSSGLINAEYAGPPEVLPIKSLTQRYFMDKSCTMVELEPVIKKILGKQKDMIAHCENLDYMDDKTKASVIRFLNKSFDILKDRKKAKRALGVKFE